jgi:hypothetical protein
VAAAIPSARFRHGSPKVYVAEVTFVCRDRVDIDRQHIVFTFINVSAPSGGPLDPPFF